MINDRHKRICEGLGSRLLVAGLFSTLMTGLIGCSTLSATSSGSVDYARRVRALEKELKRRKSEIQDLKERNLVLEKRDRNGVEFVDESGSQPAELPDSFEPQVSAKAQSIVMPTAASTATPIAKPAAAASVAALPVAVASPMVAPKIIPKLDVVPELLSASEIPTGEHFLYSKIIDSYRTRNKAEFQKTTELLLKTYPDSVFSDNALFLSGVMAFESGDSISARQAFDRLLRDYPRSNKAVAALFAKGSIERKSGRMSEAKKSFLKVRDLFPGSPEAARVSLELKLLEMNASKRRES